MIGNEPNAASSLVRRTSYLVIPGRSGSIVFRPWNNCVTRSPFETSAKRYVTPRGFRHYPNSTTTCDVITDVKDPFSKIISIKVFPNPFQSSATLQLNSYSENTELKIYNALGEQVRHQKIISQFTPINRERLSDGIYFFQVTHSKGQLTNGKFMIE